MPLARDLNELLQKYGSAIAKSAESVLVPHHKSGAPLPDLSELEAYRSTATGRPFKFFDSQRETIAGALAGLHVRKRVWMVADCGTGKSAMSLATAWALLKHKPFRILVLCPSHLVRKWERECECLLPGVACKIIRSFGDLLKFEVASKTTPLPMVMIVSKEVDLIATGRAPVGRK
jgi:hypothetical protein